MLAQQKQDILESIQRAVAPLLVGSELNPTVLLERPRDPAHGDIACNIAMQIAKPLKKNPREVAQAIVDAIAAEQSPLIASCEIAGPGFINVRVTPAAKQAVVKTILTQTKQFGRGQRGAGKKVVVEFVSANPTGPLHVGHGRQAALGDS